MSSSALRPWAQYPPGLRFLSPGQMGGFPSVSVHLLRWEAGCMCVRLRATPRVTQGAWGCCQVQAAKRRQCLQVVLGAGAGDGMQTRESMGRRSRNMQDTGAFTFCCYIAHYHTLRGLSSHGFCVLGASRCGSAGSSAQRLSQAVAEVSARMGSHLKAPLGSIYFLQLLATLTCLFPNDRGAGGHLSS